MVHFRGFGVWGGGGSVLPGQGFWREWMGWKSYDKCIPIREIRDCGQLCIFVERDYGYWRIPINIKISRSKLSLLCFEYHVVGYRSNLYFLNFLEKYSDLATTKQRHTRRAMNDKS